MSNYEEARHRAEEALAEFEDTVWSPTTAEARLASALRDLLDAEPTDGGSAPDEPITPLFDRFGECVMCGRTFRAGLPKKVAAAARAYTRAVWDHEHCDCVREECAHMVAKRVAAYETANAAVAAKDGTDV